MKRLRPFRQYWAAVLTGFALLVNAVIGSHYLANRTQRRRLERRIDALESAISDLKERDYSTSPSAVTIEPPQSVNAPKPQQKKPRIIGTGRNRTFRYTDVRYPDGYKARYYLRLNATPAQVRSFVLTLEQDAQEHQEQAVEISEYM